MQLLHYVSKQNLTMEIFKKNENYNERDTILRIKLGDASSYERMFMRYYPRFRVFVLRFVQDEATAEDILQNIFLKIWLNRHSLHEDQSMTAYIFVLARNEVFQWMRFKLTHQITPFEMATEQIASMALPGVDSEYDYSELEERLRKAVDELPPKRQEIFRMNRYEFKSAKEIAAIKGLSTRTVEKQIELSLRYIRGKVGSETLALFIIMKFFICAFGTQ